MVYSQALAARATAWLARPLIQAPEGRRSAEGLLELATIWAATQGLPLPECIRQCQYSDRVHDLTAYLREYARFTSLSSVMATADASQPTYQFKPAYVGQTLTADDYGKAVTADNLTDEDAEHFIKRGFGHVFQKIGAAVVAAGEQLEGVGDGLADDSEDDEPTEREQQLQDELEQATQKLAAQTTSYNAEYGRVTQALTTLQASYDKLTTDSAAALDSEKQAHATTQAQLSEVQQQLSEAQTALAAATAPKPKKAATASTDASADAATGSN